MSDQSDISPKQIDPGVKIAVLAGTVSLGEIVVFTSGSVTTDYYKINAALPAGASSISFTVTNVSSAPSTYTFSVPSASFSSSTAPSSSGTTFVNTTKHIALIWGFRLTSGVWKGSATWYNNSSAKISLAPGTYTLSNFTSDSTLTFKAINSAP